MEVHTLHGTYQSTFLKDKNGKLYPIRKDNKLSLLHFGVIHASNGYEDDDTTKYYSSPSVYFDLCLAKFEENEDNDEILTTESIQHRQAFLKQHQNWYKQREKIIKNPENFV